MELKNGLTPETIIKDLAKRLKKMGHEVEIQNNKPHNESIIKKVDSFRGDWMGSVARCLICNWKNAYQLTIQEYRCNGGSQEFYRMDGDFPLDKIAAKISEVTKRKQSELSIEEKKQDVLHERRTLVEECAKELDLELEEEIPDPETQKIKHPIFKPTYWKFDHALAFDVYLKNKTELKLFLKAMKEIKRLREVITERAPGKENVLSFPE